MITFAAGSTLFAPSLPLLYAGFQNAPTLAPNPGIALLWTDISPTFGTTYDVAEDTTTGVVTVRFRNLRYFSSGDFAGDVSVSFGAIGPGSFVMDHTAVVPGLTATESIVVGVTDGNDSIGSDRKR